MYINGYLLRFFDTLYRKTHSEREKHFSLKILYNFFNSLNGFSTCSNVLVEIIMSAYPSSISSAVLTECILNISAFFLADSFISIPILFFVYNWLSKYPPPDPNSTTVSEEQIYFSKNIFSFIFAPNSPILFCHSKYHFQRAVFLYHAHI